MSISEETIQAVTRLLNEENTNTNKTGKYPLIHHPYLNNRKTTTTVVINEHQTVIPKPGQTTLKNSQVSANSVDDQVNNETEEILYEARPIDANKAIPATSTWKYKDGYREIPRRHPCKFCTKLFLTPWQVKRHEVTHLKVKPYKCSTCNKRFDQEGRLQLHQSIHTGIWRFTCTTCNAHFNKKYQYYAHLLKYRHGEHESVPLHYYIVNCKICGRECKKMALNAHMRTHMTEEERDKHRIHRCQNCGRSFFTRYDLLNHLASHSDVRPYSCKDCKRSFKTQKSMTKHRRFCKGVECVQCMQCGLSFSTEIRLDKHTEKCHTEHQENTNKSEKIVNIFCVPPDEIEHLAVSDSTESRQTTYQTCGICYKQFAKTTFLRVHMRKHSSGDVYSCDKCNTWFTELSELNGHVCENSSVIS